MCRCQFRACIDKLDAVQIGTDDLHAPFNDFFQNVNPNIKNNSKSTVDNIVVRFLACLQQKKIFVIFFGCVFSLCLFLASCHSRIGNVCDT